jgi:hypothetical protein
MEERSVRLGGVCSQKQHYPEDGASCELGDEEDSAQHGGCGEGHGDQAGWVGEQAGHQPVQSREAIGRAVANSVTEMVDGRYRQAFGQQAVKRFERAMGSMMQQISEQELFMEGSMRLFWGGGWRWRM